MMYWIFVFSTISSGLNSIAAVILEDIIKAYIAPDISEHKATRATQILGKISFVIFLKNAFRSSLRFSLRIYIDSGTAEALSTIKIS